MLGFAAIATTGNCAIRLQIRKPCRRPRRAKRPGSASPRRQRACCRADPHGYALCDGWAAMGRREQQIEHLLRRAGFGGSPNEVDLFAEVGVRGTVDLLVYYEQFPDDVDAFIGQTGYVGVTVRGTFTPHLNITDARQRWLFRMVHTQRPLQEKMALFWHNHFATAYTQIAG